MGGMSLSGRWRRRDRPWLPLPYAGKRDLHTDPPTSFNIIMQKERSYCAENSELDKCNTESLTSNPS